MSLLWYLLLQRVLRRLIVNNCSNLVFLRSIRTAWRMHLPLCSCLERLGRHLVLSMCLSRRCDFAGSCYSNLRAVRNPNFFNGPNSVLHHSRRRGNFGLLRGAVL